MFEDLNEIARERLHAARVRSLARSCLRLPEEAVLAVHEMHCSEPGCAPLHTVVFVLWPDRVDKLKFQKAITDISEEDFAIFSHTPPSQENSTL